MSIKIRIFMLAILVPLCALVVEANELRVLTYNIHHAEGTDGVLDIKRIAAVINSVTPDIVALQEVDNQTERSLKADQASELGKLTGMNAYYAKAIDFQGGEYGVAILCKLRVHQFKSILLPNTPGREQRVAAVVDVSFSMEKDSPADFRFMATHLDHLRDDADRKAAVPALNQIAAEADGLPAMLAGDLNALPESGVFQALLKTWSAANGAAAAFTFPAERPIRQIDYILFRPADRWRSVKTTVLDAPVASDHAPLFSVIDLFSDIDLKK